MANDNIIFDLIKISFANEITNDIKEEKNNELIVKLQDGSKCKIIVNTI